LIVVQSLHFVALAMKLDLYRRSRTATSHQSTCKNVTPRPTCDVAFRKKRTEKTKGAENEMTV